MDRDSVWGNMGTERPPLMALKFCPLGRHCPGRPKATATTLLNTANLWRPIWRTLVWTGVVLVSIVDSISACHAEDRGSIPRRGASLLF